MDTVKHNAIKKAQAKEYVTVSLSGLFSYPKDNPSRKRDARCTNTIQTGATLQVWANEQRLRKGFQGQKRRGSLTMWLKTPSVPIGKRLYLKYGLIVAAPTAYLESLSSAAEIRHSARNTRL